jgi:hypothetical protein
MKKTLLAVLFSALSGCAGFLTPPPYAPPQAETDQWQKQIEEGHAFLAESRQEAQAEQERQHGDSCRAARKAHQQALDARDKAAAAIGTVTDEEREEQARRQGDAREGDVCYVYRKRGQSLVAVQVDCGRPAHDYREMNAFAGPGLVPVPPECL